jgi:hypothetical protein
MEAHDIETVMRRPPDMELEVKLRGVTPGPTDHSHAEDPC